MRGGWSGRRAAVLVTARDFHQCKRMSLGGSTLSQTQRFSWVLINAASARIHRTEVPLCVIKALPRSQPTKRQRLGASTPQRPLCKKERKR